MGDKDLRERLGQAREAAHECVRLAQEIKSWANAIPRPLVPDPIIVKAFIERFTPVPGFYLRAMECQENWGKAFPPAIDDLILGRCADPNRVLTISDTRWATAHRAAFAALVETFQPLIPVLDTMRDIQEGILAGADEASEASWDTFLNVIATFNEAVGNIRQLDICPFQDVVEIVDAEYAAVARDSKEETTLLPTSYPGGPDKEARDKWFYEQAIKGVAWAAIVRLLDKKSVKWERVKENGAKKAAAAYAEFHVLTSVPPRQPGRGKTRS